MGHKKPAGAKPAGGAIGRAFSAADFYFLSASFLSLLMLLLLHTGHCLSISGAAGSKGALCSCPHLRHLKVASSAAISKTSTGCRAGDDTSAKHECYAPAAAAFASSFFCALFFSFAAFFSRSSLSTFIVNSISSAVTCCLSFSISFITRANF